MQFALEMLNNLQMSLLQDDDILMNQLFLNKWSNYTNSNNKKKLQHSS